MSRVSKRLTRIPGSVTLAISARARELTAQGVDVISFAAGEPDFSTPEHIAAAAARAVYDPANHHYTNNAGLEPLRAAVADYTHTFSGVAVDPAHVLITNGAKQAVFQAFAALIDPGDEVLMPAPYWVTYPSGIDLAGGTTVPVPTGADQGFKVTVSDLDAVVTERTKALVFVSPSNPTGAVYTAEEARAIGDWAAERDIWVIADEIYQRLTYFTDVAPSVVGLTPGLENWIIINGVAKSYAMTGWRVGWMTGPGDVIAGAARHQSHATGNVANVAQVAAEAALSGPQDTVDSMREAFGRRRRLMYEMVSAIDGVECVEPAGAFYVFPDVSDAIAGRWGSTAEFAEAVINEASVAIIPGESFGAPGFVRLSYALGESDIERGVSRIASLLGG